MKGVVQQDIVLPDGLPDGRRAFEGRRWLGREGFVHEIGPVDGVVQFDEIGKSGEAFRGVEILRLQFQFVHQDVQDARRQLRVVLQPYRGPVAPVANALLDDLEQVLRAFLLVVHVGVPRHADRRAVQHLVTVVEQVEVHLDDVLQHEESLPAVFGREFEEPRHDRGGQVDDREVRMGENGFLDLADFSHETERAVGQVGKRMARVHRQRGHHRQDGLPEVLVQIGLLRRAELLRLEDVDALLGELREDLVDEESVLLVDQFVHPGRERGHYLPGTQAVGGPRRLDLRVDLSLDAGDADHEELVQVGAEYGQELHPFQQGNRRVERFLQHPRVELHPAQFPVEEVFRAPVVRHQRRDGRPGLVGEPAPRSLRGDGSNRGGPGVVPIRGRHDLSHLEDMRFRAWIKYP